jgi:hypothetical protein
MEINYIGNKVVSIYDRRAECKFYLVDNDLEIDREKIVIPGTFIGVEFEEFIHYFLIDESTYYCGLVYDFTSFIKNDRNTEMVFKKYNNGEYNINSILTRRILSCIKNNMRGTGIQGFTCLSSRFFLPENDIFSIFENEFRARNVSVYLLNFDFLGEKIENIILLKGNQVKDKIMLLEKNNDSIIYSIYNLNEKLMDYLLNNNKIGNYMNKTYLFISNLKSTKSADINIDYIKYNYRDLNHNDIRRIERESKLKKILE